MENRDARKTSILIREIRKQYPTVPLDYIGIDIQDDIYNGIAQLAFEHKSDNVHVSGILGLFDDALDLLRPFKRRKIVVCWGSTLLNTTARDPRPLENRHARLLETLQPGDFIIFSQDKGTADSGKMVGPF